MISNWIIAETCKFVNAPFDCILEVLKYIRVFDQSHWGCSCKGCTPVSPLFIRSLSGEKTLEYVRIFNCGQCADYVLPIRVESIYLSIASYQDQNCFFEQFESRPKNFG